MAKGHGFAFHPLLTTEENDELFGNPDFWNPLKTAPLSARWGVKFLRRQYDLLSNLITPDTVLVANPKLMRSPCRQSLSKSLPPGTSLKLFLDPPPAGGCKRYVI